MLDHFLPDPRLVEIDHADVGVPPEKAYQALRHFDASSSPLVRTLFTLRALPDMLTGHRPEVPKLSIDAIGSRPEPGFRILADEPGRSVTVGAAGKVWEAEIPYADVPAERFAAFDEPGYAKVVWELRCEPRGAGARVVLELRVGATDDESWDRTRRYFRFIGPFSHWIRRHCLGMLEKELGSAEQMDSGRALPGDEKLPDAAAASTLSITIAASPDEVWPYLVQMGAQRAGWYSYDSLDNAGRESAWDVLPELQSLEVGQIIAAMPSAEGGYEVLSIDPGRALVLGGLYDTEEERQLPFSGARPARYWQVTWAFALEPLGPSETKLLVRARVSFAPERMKWKVTWMAPVHHFMEMEQLRNIKARAERLAATRRAS